jgi:hypothetical protein
MSWPKSGVRMGLDDLLFSLLTIVLGTAGVWLLIDGWRESRDGRLVAGAVLAGCCLITSELASLRRSRQDRT